MVTAPLTNGLSDKTDDSSITVVNGSLTSNSSVICDEYHMQEQHLQQLEIQQFHPKNELLQLQQQSSPSSLPSELPPQQEIVVQVNHQQQEIEPRQTLVQDHHQQLLLQEPVLDQEQQTQEILQPVTELEPVEYPEVPYVETLPPQPMHHVSHHVIPQTCAPSYVYPGQYMFGTSVVNVDGLSTFSIQL